MGAIRRRDGTRTQGGESLLISQTGVAGPSVPTRTSMWRRVEGMVTGVLTVLVVILLVLAVALAVLVKTGPAGESVILGHPVFSVRSGSMTPTFDTGDLIIDRTVTPTEATKLHKGQIISFRADSPITGGVPVIISHRIYAVTLSLGALGAPQVMYTTKGDANNSPDANPVAPGAVLGVYQARIPYGGYVLSALHQPITFILLIMIPVVYLVAVETRRRWIAIGEQEREAKDGGEGGRPW